MDHKNYIIETLNDYGRYMLPWWRRDKSSWDDYGESWSEFVKCLNELTKEGIVKIYYVRYGWSEIPIYYIDYEKCKADFESESFRDDVRRSYVYNC